MRGIRRRWHSPLRLGLLVLLALWTAQASAAELAILWRVSVLSWDDPGTQLEDEVASQGVLDTDAFRRAREQAAVALSPSGRLLPLGPARHAPRARYAHLTRSPPVA